MRVLPAFTPLEQQTLARLRRLNQGGNSRMVALYTMVVTLAAVATGRFIASGSKVWILGAVGMLGLHTLQGFRAYLRDTRTLPGIVEKFEAALEGPAPPPDASN